MTTLIERLKRFNRKERFFLVGLALGNPDFTLGSDFRLRLGKRFNLAIPLEGVFVAMDYHLEWLYAALRDADTSDPPRLNTGFVKGNQEDVDLLVAFEDGTTTHVILIEAKGETAWSNKQMKSKAERLRVAFEGVDESVTPHFAFVSPTQPQHLIPEGWPAWITTDTHLDMKITGDLKVTRCDVHGHPKANGDYWMICSVRSNPPVVLGEP